MGARPWAATGGRKHPTGSDTEEEDFVSGKRQFVSGLVLACALALPALAQMGGHEPPLAQLPPELSNVGIDQKLNQQVPLDLIFRDEAGRPVTLAQLFQGRPVILNLVYYECPMLCTEVLNGLSSSLRLMQLDIGRDYDVLTVSFDAREKPELATAKKKAYLQRYGRPGAELGWHFLTGEQPSIDALTRAVGFRYQWDAKTQQFAHAAGIMILTPQGRVAQYYYGVEYSPRDLRLGLVEASQNKIGNVVDQVLLYCYHYDPRIGKYGAVVMNVIRLGGGVTILILGSFLVVLFRRERKPEPVSEYSRSASKR
jgi:protein SCO1/2